MRAMVERLTSMDAEQHRLVSLIGNIAPDGSASLLRCDHAHRRQGARAALPDAGAGDRPRPRERDLSRAEAGPSVVNLAQAADVIFVGVGQMSNDAPLLKDGFVTRAELDEMQARGRPAKWPVGSMIRRGIIWKPAPTSASAGVRVTAGEGRPTIGNCWRAIQGSRPDRRA